MSSHGKKLQRKQERQEGKKDLSSKIDNYFESVNALKKGKELFYSGELGKAIKEINQVNENYRNAYTLSQKLKDKIEQRIILNTNYVASQTKFPREGIILENNPTSEEVKYNSNKILEEAIHEVEFRLN